MYKNLTRILSDKCITTKALASLLDVTEKTALSKVRGASDFTLPEAIKICSVICPEYKLDYVFATVDSVGVA